MTNADRVSTRHLDLLEPKSSGDFGLSGFFEAEAGEQARWRWTQESIAEVTGYFSAEKGVRLDLTITAPQVATKVEIGWNDQTVWTWTSQKPWEEVNLNQVFFGSANPWKLKVQSSKWNGSPSRFAEDQRPLGLLIKGGDIREGAAGRGTVCPYPFSRMEWPGDSFVPCCSAWLKPEYFSLPGGPDPWNGPAAHALRKSIYDGSFRYCQLDRCRVKPLPISELRSSDYFPISDANLQAIKEQFTILPEGPGGAVLMGDPRCNLACPSCRREKITKLDSLSEKRTQEMLDLVQQYGRNLKTIKIAGDGELFFSPDLKRIASEADRLFPELESVEVLSNGLLFDSHGFLSLGPARKLVKRVRISVDAGDEPTYQKTRGGDWSRLLSNLQWISEQRVSSTFLFFGLNFVLRRENYRSLISFLELCERLQVDEAHISKLLPWDRAPISMIDETIENPQHPAYPELLALWREVEKRPWSFSIRSNLNLPSVSYTSDRFPEPTIAVPPS